MSALRRALLSVSDKRGLAGFAAQLQRRGIELLSTGGTGAALVNAGIPSRDVAEYTGFPELMDGRLKTLHPLVHGGLLGRRGVDDAVMQQYGILPIDLLVVNLYPFAATIARPGASYAQAIDNIDIGGPAMLRAAAKNHADVTVVVDPDDYDRVVAEIDAAGATSIDTRARLAAKAFAHTARYDALIAGFLQRRDADDELPGQLTLCYDKQQDLRYGENPHQRAAFYRAPLAGGAGIGSAQLLQGKELSYNNIVDADTAIECVRRFEAPACVIVKHANPCGVALGSDPQEAYALAYRTDPASAFGGVIAFNRALDTHCAGVICAQQFAEVIAAPSISAQARAVFAAKAAGLRVLQTGDLHAPANGGADTAALELRSVTGGLLLQQRDADLRHLEAGELKVVTRRHPDERELADLRFAWEAVQYVKSNAIVLARGRATIGVGGGQTSRVDSVRVAILKAGNAQLPIPGAAMASDAFFPFRDGIDVAAAQAVTAVIQPGGSRRDAEVIAAADEHGMAMVLTGVRHFRH